MKKLLFAMLAFALVSLSAGCESASEKVRRQREEKAEVETEDERLKRLLDEAENSPEVETDLFLGFKFGMTREQANNVLKNLRNKGEEITYENFEGIEVKLPTYTFKGGKEDIKIGIIESFHDDKLYQVYYMLSKGGFEVMKEAFTKSERYKAGGFNLAVEDDYQGKTYHYIKDNLLIQFDSLRASMISTAEIMRYSNVPILRKVEREEEAEKKAEEEKLKSMF